MTNSKNLLPKNLLAKEFIRPLPLTAMLIMALNDHWWRVMWPNVWTGKISDFAVVLFFPTLLTSSWNILLLIGNMARKVPWDTNLTLKKLNVACFITIISLGGINLSPTLRDLYVSFLDTIDFFSPSPNHYYTVDPTDLIAFLFIPFAWLDGKRALEETRK